MSDAATDAGHATAAEHDHPHVNYIAKFGWLVALTTVEVIVAMNVEGGLKLFLLTFLSLWKAAIVLNYFMHLKSENLALKLALCFPLALIAILVTLFLADGYWMRYPSGM